MGTPKKPRKAYRPRGVNRDAAVMAMMGAANLGTSDRVQFMVPVQAALNAIEQGTAEQAHWREIFDACNTIEALFKAGLSRDWRDWHESTQQTIVDILDRQKTTGTRALRAPELAVLRELVATWGDVLKVVSKRELYAALDSVARRCRSILASRPAGVTVIEP